MPRHITPFLWFDTGAEEATNSYVSLFMDSEVLSINRMGGDDGPVFTTSFRLDRQEFVATNGGPLYSFTEAISLMIDRETRDEAHHVLHALTDGGAPGRRGWLKDKFGLSLQVAPRRRQELLGDHDPAAAGRVVQAMPQTNKSDIAGPQWARAGD